MKSRRDCKTLSKISLSMWLSMHPVWSFYSKFCRTKSYWDEIKIINHSNFLFISFIWFIIQNLTEWNQVLFRYPTKSGLLYRIYFQSIQVSISVILYHTCRFTELLIIFLYNIYCVFKIFKCNFKSGKFLISRNKCEWRLHSL